MTRLQYRRVVLKLSGEALAGENGRGIDPDVLRELSEEVVEIHDLGCELAIVVGGGNIFRGFEGSSRGMDRAGADMIGMLATVMNGLALQDSLERAGLSTRVMTAIEMRQIAEPYIRRRATRHLEKSRVVILAGGTGNPFFTTDTAASLRAMEIGANVVLKATKVDGVYDRDPMKDSSAKRFSTLTFQEVLTRGLEVMDATAISLCKQHAIPILVFSLTPKGNIHRVLCGEPLGTLVHKG